MTPQGPTFTQAMAKELAKENDLIFLCGHYEGIDERVLEELVTDYVSIGDYVLTGGELPAMVMVDAISRMVPGVLSNEVSGVTESFEGYLLEYPGSTAARSDGWTRKCRRCFSVATRRRSESGGRKEPSSAPGNGGRICTGSTAAYSNAAERLAMTKTASY